MSGIPSRNPSGAGSHARRSSHRARSGIVSTPQIDRPMISDTERQATAGRRGFSLVEVIVAILLLALGMLALTGSSAVIASQLAGGAQMTVAATLAQSRLESLRAADCNTLHGGSAEQRGIAESWSILQGDDVVRVSDTVRLLGRGRNRQFVFNAIFPCAVDR